MLFRSVLFQLEPQNAYSKDYNTVLDEAQAEKRSNVRPQIKGDIVNFDRYDVIYLGYPNWWADMPMILYSFLEQYNMEGKTIVPFVTHGGSGFSGTVNSIRQLQPKATVLDGISIRSSEANNSANTVKDWLSSQGLID